jgi:hypothetical protein
VDAHVIGDVEGPSVHPQRAAQTRWWTVDHLAEPGSQVQPAGDPVPYLGDASPSNSPAPSRIAITPMSAGQPRSSGTKLLRAGPVNRSTPTGGRVVSIAPSPIFAAGTS